MKSILLPHRYKMIGWYILIPSTIVGIILVLSNFSALSLNTKVLAIAYDPGIGPKYYFEIITLNITNSIVGFLFILGSLLICFSKEKLEDEFIAKLRLTSLLWALLVNYGLLLFTIVFIYGFSFIYILLYNMFTILIVFIARFHFLMFKYKRQLKNEQ